MGAWVIVQRGGEVGRRYDLDAARLTVGRDPGNDLVLDAAAVERYHAVLVRRGMRHAIIDLGAARPVTVDGVALEPGDPHPLRHGDTLAIGDEVALLFHQPAAGADPAAQPTLPLRATLHRPDATVRLPTRAPAAPLVPRASLPPPPPSPPTGSDDDPTLRLPTIPPAPGDDTPGDNDPTLRLPTARPAWLGRLWRPGARRPRR